jgi:hypothetical protein
VSLKARLAREIALTGPLSVADYVTRCLHDPQDGYYATRPRLGAEDAEERTIDSDEVPTRVQHAACELALLHATSALNASHERGGAIRREKVGPLETEYEPGAAVESWLPILDRMLGGLGARRSWLSRDPGRG